VAGLDTSLVASCGPSMDADPKPEPRFSEDRLSWWDGSQWVPASQAPDQRSASAYPFWAQRLDVSSRAGWRWALLTGLGVALAVAGYDLISGWELRGGGLALVVFIALSVFALATCVVLLVSSDRERRISAGGGPSVTVLGLAARGVRWSSLFAIGVSVLLFANCSAAVSSGNSVSGATTNPSQFWSLATLVMLPLVLALALPGGLATAAQLLASKGRLREARWVASVGLWCAALIAMVAVATAVIALSAGVSDCSFTTTASACAAGVGGLMNLTAIGSLLLIIPYLTMMNRVLTAAAGGP
jgi:hypothetical protein